MKITIEFDPGELAKGAANPAVSVVPGAAASASPTAAAQPGAAGDGGTPIDAGHAPGADATPAVTAAAAVATNDTESIPADIAAKAAAIGALSAGPAPALH